MKTLEFSTLKLVVYVASLLEGLTSLNPISSIDSHFQFQGYTPLPEFSNPEFSSVLLSINLQIDRIKKQSSVKFR